MDQKRDQIKDKAIVKKLASVFNRKKGEQATAQEEKKETAEWL